MYQEVIFDIETKKLFDQIEDPSNLPDLGVSIVSVYRRELDEDLNEINGEMKSFWEKDLPQMWSWFEGADRVIGFNSIKFDAAVLSPLYQRDIFKLPHFDILTKVKEVLGHRLSLDVLARETLGESKLANGLEAVDWWNEGSQQSLAKLQKYCEQDVVVTTRLYDHVLKNGQLRFKNKWNELKEFNLDFSYPRPQPQIQMGLF